MEQVGEESEMTGEALKEAFEGAGESSEEATEGLERFSEKLEEINEKTNESAEAMTKLASGWEGFMSLLGAGAVTELMNSLIERTIEFGTEIRNTSAMLQVSASDSRAFMETMDALGVSTQATSMAIRRLETDAATGGKKLAELGISAKDTNGQFRTGIDLFTTVIEKLANIQNAGEQAAAGTALFGRSWTQMAAVLDEIPGKLEENIKDQRENTDVNNDAIEAANKLRQALSDLGSAWNDAIITISPLVIAACQEMASALGNLSKQVIGLWNAIHAGDWAGAWGAVFANNFSQKGGNWGFAGILGGKPAPSAIGIDDQSARHIDEISGPAYNKGAYGMIKPGMEAQVDALNRNTEVLTAIDRSQGYSPDAAAHGGEAHFTPTARGGKGGGGKGGGGGADPMAGLDQQLQASTEKMAKMGEEFDKLGDEAKMAAKVSEDSYKDLADKARQDFFVMEDAHAKFTQEVEAGDKAAAMNAEKEWQRAAATFQDAWKKAEEKAKQDMQDLKTVATTISSEISGILNQAISGKLNWAQEMQKILTQMSDMLVKYLSTMLTEWITTHDLMAASAQAAHGNMLGELINWLMSTLSHHTTTEAATTAVQATGQATRAALQAGGDATAIATAEATKAAQVQLDAGLAGANTMAALSGIPVIGPALAAATAPTMVAETETIGLAALGADLPSFSGVMPVGVHSREMILPEIHADTIRKLGQDGATAGGSKTLNQTFQIQSLDPSSLGDIVMKNPDLFAGAAARALRGGYSAYTG